MQHNDRGFIGIVVVVVLAVALIAGGVYAFFNGTSFLKKAKDYSKLTVGLAAEIPDELDKELQSLDLGGVDSEFADIDRDLSSL